MIKKTNKKIIENYKLILGGVPFSMIDIGARGGNKGVWNYNLNSIVNFIFFEPDEKEAEKLAEQFGVNTIVIPCAVWSQEQVVELNITKNRSYCSVLNPDLEVIKDSLYYNRGFYDIEEKKKINSNTLESLLKKHNCLEPDFLKIDIQGGEKIVFDSFLNTTWNNLIGIDTESYSSNLYEKCGNISDILQLLYENNFEIYNILPIANFLYTSYGKEKLYDASNLNCRPKSSNYYGRKMVFDLLLFKKIKSITMMKSEELIRKFLFIFMLYQYYDHGLYLIYKAHEKDIISKRKFELLKRAIRMQIDIDTNYYKRLREKYLVKNYKL